MKILEPGPDFTLPWGYKTECGKCHTKVELDLDDIKKGDESTYADAFPEWCLYWECPFCGNQPNLPTNMWKAIQHHRPALKW